LYKLILLFFLTSFNFSHGKPWGIYQILWTGRQYKTQLGKQLSLLGGRPSYVTFFRDLKRSFPSTLVKYNNTKGLKTIISLELLVWRFNSGNENDYLARIIAGKYDAFFRKWALAARKTKIPVILRFGFEMNGDWFSWGEKPELFKQAWIRAYHIIMAICPKEVEWMFSINALWDDKTFAINIEPYFPGKAYVHLIGLDGYNFGDNYSPYHKWTSYEMLFSKTIQAVSKYRLPILISEIGCADDERKSYWMKNFLEKIENDKRIKAFIYFNFDKSREKEPNWRLDSDTKTLKIFRNWVAGN